MTSGLLVQVNQAGSSASVGLIRDHRIMIDRPHAKGGQDQGPMGGELLLASLGGCFMSNLLAAISSREADISDVRLSIEGALDGTPPRLSVIAMKVSATCSDRDLLQKLVTISERSCIVANTLKDAVQLTIVLV